MKYITGEEGFVFDVGSLYARFEALTDQRARRGIRYPLPKALTLILLAKLGGEDTVRGMATWLKHRTERLARALGLARARMPHRTTISRILGHAVLVEEFEETVGSFFKDSLKEGDKLVIAIDGKTMRGTIEAGQNRGVHLLGAYVPGEGVVLFQTEVAGKENEIPAAPRVLERLDLREAIVVGDAMHTQRRLSAQIVAEGGDYVWVVKENQPQLRDDIAAAFQPVPCVPGFHPGPRDHPTAETVDKGHGRIEKRTITVTSELKGFLDWPGMEQVFQLERHFVYPKKGNVREETTYGITSLSPQRASPARLLEVARAYWGIENGLHYRRDVTFQEDRCRLRTGHAAHMMAALNNLAIGLIARCGFSEAPEARRQFCAEPLNTLALIIRA
jgi:predicted transposase YbfD/YdcC